MKHEKVEKYECQKIWYSIIISIDFMKSTRGNKINRIILGDDRINKIEGCRVLVVGAGGIGC